MANQKKRPHCDWNDTESIFRRRDRTSKSPGPDGGLHISANSKYEALEDAGLISWIERVGRDRNRTYATDLPRGSYPQRTPCQGSYGLSGNRLSIAP